ncbi:MAG: hypothetical protein K0S28_328 [Paucimonas sp.]|jgi:hypothetical protein|nr:hypothetical protein [Paucimonas sp.]
MNGSYGSWPGKLVLLLLVIIAAPACNQSQDAPNAPPKPQTRTMSGYADDMPKEEAELKSAVFTYSKHKGKAQEAEEDERPLADTVIRVTT